MHPAGYTPPSKDNACVDKCAGCIYRREIIWMKGLLFCKIFYRPDVQWNHFPPCPNYETSTKSEVILNKRNKIINTFVEDSLMDSICDLLKTKLNEYGYKIYQLNETSDKNQFCLMTESMMIFIDEKERSLTLSFEYTLEPEKVGQNIMIINEIDQVKFIYISESYMFDDLNKRYVVGSKAKELVFKLRKNLILREITEQQLYRNVLMTHKCHEC